MAINYANVKGVMRGCVARKVEIKLFRSKHTEPRFDFPDSDKT